MNNNNNKTKLYGADVWTRVMHNIHIKVYTYKCTFFICPLPISSTSDKQRTTQTENESLQLFDGFRQ